MSRLHAIFAMGAACAVSAVLTACAQNASTPARSAPGSSAGCASARGLAGAGQRAGTITVCPARGPVGTVVRVTIDGCAPGRPAAALQFLGPGSWLGTDGGGGANVPFAPVKGRAATVTFTIPATYTGGNANGGAYPVLPVRPGTSYRFATEPAGECGVPFTVTTGA